MNDKVVNLCKTCIYEYGSCEAENHELDPEGSDSVIKCESYIAEGAVVSSEPSPEPSPGLAVVKTEAICGSCSQPLKITPVNRRVRALICDNPRCGLYREKVKTYSIPKPTPQLARGQYWCNRCGQPHRETSKIGRKHLQYKRGRQ